MDNLQEGGLGNSGVQEMGSRPSLQLIQQQKREVTLAISPSPGD